MKKQLSFLLAICSILLFYPSQGFAANECSESTSIFKTQNIEDSHLFAELINAERNNKVKTEDLMVTNAGISLAICESYVNDNKISYSFKVIFDEELLKPSFFNHDILNKPLISVNGEWVNHSDVIWTEKVSENEYIGIQIVDVHTKEIKKNDIFEVIYQMNLGQQGIWELVINEKEKAVTIEETYYGEKFERAYQSIPHLLFY